MTETKQIERQAHGWFKPGPRSYATLLKSDAVSMLAETYTPKGRASNLYCLQQFLEINSLGPEEFLKLPDLDVKKCIRKAILQKRKEGCYAQGRKMFYVVRRFLELNDREVAFKRTEKKLLLKLEPKKNGREYVPTREDIYRIVDAFPDKGAVQRKRGQALFLCLWQSGVRASCLCSWTYGMFKKTLWPMINPPVPIKVLAHREEGFNDVAEDTKLSSYSVGYYYTFLAYESAKALKDYMEERQAHGWKPKESDPVFVTHGTVKEANNKPLTAQHLVEIVKSGAKQIGIEPRRIWTHCLRKAFRKTMYSSGVDPDIAEALMGHKLGASRGSYFDYHDLEFARKNYSKGNWTRLGYDRLRQLEEEVSEANKLREKIRQLEAMILTVLPLGVKVEDLRKLVEGQRRIIQALRKEGLVKEI